MIRIAFAFSAALLAGVVSSGLAQTAPEPNAPKPAAPNLTVEPPNWDFGTVLFGTPLKQEVAVRNTGDAVLEIQNVRSSCGCTGSNLGKNRLAPGEATTLRVTYDSTKGREQVRQTIRITTNDPDTPVYTFYVSGRCEPIFEFEPKNLAAVNFGQLDARSERTESVVIKNIMKDRDIRLKLTRDDVPPYKLKLEELEPGKAYKLSATTHPPLKAGSQARLAYLETDLDFMKRLKIRLNGYVVPPVRVTPSVLYVSPKIPLETKRDVLVTYQKDKPVKVTKIECDDERIKWERVEPTEGQQRRITTAHRLRFTVPPGKDIPEGGLVVKIHTDSDVAGYEVLNLPIRPQPQRSTRAAAAQRALQARQAQLAREQAAKRATVKPVPPTKPAEAAPQPVAADQAADE